VDVFEDENKVVLQIEVPGVRLEDLDVRVENNTLTVKGERAFKNEGNDQNFQRLERRYGSFQRSFTVSNAIDQEGIQADYEAGILRLELHKKPESKPRQIKVNVAATKEVKQEQAA
jgi:HSP20 family protein